ncbi:MAG: DUF4174 domain-containing protein [Pseudomonadota bacterium]
MATLSDLTWQHRVLVVRTPAGGAAVNTLKQRAAAVGERDLIWFVLHEEQLLSNYSGVLAADFAATLTSRLAASGAAVLLIGKDGGTKLAASVLDLEEIFARIDTMPMRRSEMRRQETRRQATRQREVRQQQERMR